jgi:hypothetical protein
VGGVVVGVWESGVLLDLSESGTSYRGVGIIVSLKIYVLDLDFDL